METPHGRKTYMDYWHFSESEKEQLIQRLTEECYRHIKTDLLCYRDKKEKNDLELLYGFNSLL